jgi:hypothetical protein
MWANRVLGIRHLFTAVLIAISAGACDDITGPPVAGGVRVEVRVTGGFAGVDFSFEILGGQGVVRGLSCANHCDFEPGEIILPLSSVQIQMLAADLEDAGILELDGRDFGTQCCDDFHYEVSYNSGFRTSTVQGHGQRFPSDLLLVVRRMVAMAEGRLSALVDQDRLLTLPSDGYTLGPIQIEGDFLDVELSFGGGCERHEIDLALRGPWLESFPVRADMEIAHEDNDDPCDAFLTETRSFDLRPIRAAYLAVYPTQQPGPTTLILRFFDPEEPSGLREVEYVF